MTEQTHQPVTVRYVAGLAYPKPIAAAVKAYEAAHAAWREEFAALTSAHAALERAVLADEEAFRAAIAAGTTDPGRVHERSASSAISEAEERTRVAREKATETADVLKAAIAGGGTEVIDLVVGQVRPAVDSYLAVLDDARSQVETARAAVVNAFGGIGAVTGLIEKHYGLHLGPIAVSPKQVQWPMAEEASLLGSVARVENLGGDIRNQRDSAAVPA